MVGRSERAFMIHRVGTFFILLGLLLIGMFVMADIAKVPSCNFFLFGAVSLGLGIFLWFRDPVKPGEPSGRFRILRGKKSEKKP